MVWVYVFAFVGAHIPSVRRRYCCRHAM